jgi:ribosomal protein S14
MTVTVHFLNNKDSKIRKFYKRHEMGIFFFKSILADQRVSYNVRFLLKNRILLQKINFSRFSIVKIRNRCKETGRSRFILSFIGLSRASFKNDVSKGFLTGFKKK